MSLFRSFLIAVVCIAPLSLNTHAGQDDRRFEIDGYDLTALVDQQKLVKGSARFAARFDRHTYHFESRESRKRFLRTPHRYVPALGGDCVVCFADKGVRVPGSTRHAVLHNKRLYLFPDSETRKVFREDPGKYEDIDLVANGNSIVWAVNRGHQVPGLPAWTVVVDGLRYQFSSAEERGAFLQNRTHFIRLWRNPSLRPIRPGITTATSAAVPGNGTLPSPASQFSSLQIAGGQQPSQLFQLRSLQIGLTGELQALRNLEQISAASR